ncbi:exported hypothetical protein [Rhodococcus sp. RD6.2]|jgi:hypothetical protein|nr:exported hypothetical protein [Rhodococcus sp. RD6.2]
MSRNLARRGASVLVAAAVLGGGLALGGGTASAAEPYPDSDNWIVDFILTPLVAQLGSAEGPIQSGSAAVGSADSGSGAMGEGSGCNGWYEGYEGAMGPGCLGPIRVLPDEVFES